VNTFFSTVISGIEDVAYEAGYNVILAQSNESYQREVTDMKALFNSRVDGMLLSLSRETTNFDHIESIISKGVPIVLYDRFYSNPNMSKVVVDDYVGAKEAVLHLIEQGCKRIAHLEGAPNLIISKDRLRGYQDALSESNLEIRESYTIVCPNNSFEEGQRAAQKLLALPHPPDAIFASNDPMAMGAILAIKEKGLSIPDDVAVVGFSNYFFAQITDPSLTSVDQPGFEMGQEAARLLIRQIEAKDKDQEDLAPETKVLKTKLIVRNSSLRKKKK
jgi:LacI family transcriptional regulator